MLSITILSSNTSIVSRDDTAKKERKIPSRCKCYCAMIEIIFNRFKNRMQSTAMEGFENVSDAAILPPQRKKEIKQLKQFSSFMCISMIIGQVMCFIRKKKKNVANGSSDIERTAVRSLVPISRLACPGKRG